MNKKLHNTFSKFLTSNYRYAYRRVPYQVAIEIGNGKGSIWKNLVNVSTIKIISSDTKMTLPMRVLTRTSFFNHKVKTLMPSPIETVEKFENTIASIQRNTPIIMIGIRHSTVLQNELLFYVQQRRHCKGNMNQIIDVTSKNKVNGNRQKLSQSNWVRFLHACSLQKSKKQRFSPLAAFSLVLSWLV